ncbi:unnamed protein product [Blepharisma stoltei]|uniref:Alpha-glucan water dikinase n=1 Tax=Blepharisma stoltei TaxID=1481888 RepID=A0AAU9JT22_9CILI|nr:unnamed protein product [Blepharisma stoltei]
MEGKVADMVNEICKAESEYGSWTLMHRCNLCNKWMKIIGNSDLESLAWIYVWMRYSELRKLDWQRKYNTRPSELAASQKNLAFTVTELIAKASKQGFVSPAWILRSILGSFGRGGDYGQRIRDQILEIMHRHRIGETYGTYLEQWHQKLHNNTTPDDIGICEATIAYWETGNMNKYWEVLHSHGITRDRLASFERPITTQPNYTPYLINDFRDFLKTLKSVHSGADLITSIEHARHCFTPFMHVKIDDVLRNLHHWDTISQIERAVWARLEINYHGNKGNNYQYRELLYVDLSLEMYIRQLFESILHRNMAPRHYIRELNLLLDNALITNEDKELIIAVNDWKSLAKRYANNLEGNREIALVLKSAADRIGRIIGVAVDDFSSLFQPKAKTIGERCKIDKDFVDFFSEEIIRASCFFAPSMILRKLDAQFRGIAKLKPWQIISPISKIQGKLIKVELLHDVAYNIYNEPTIILSKKTFGEEEIPEGVLGVISCGELDGLAHVSVRARNQKKLLAVCFNEEEIKNIEKYVDQWICVTSQGGIIIVKSAQEERFEEEENERYDAQQIKRPEPLEFIAISSDQFNERKVGAKANNCEILKRNLPEHFGVPRQVAIPYGGCEYVISHMINEEKTNKYRELIGRLEEMEHNKEIAEDLSDLKKVILELEMPEHEMNEIQEKLESIGIAKEDWEAAFLAIKKVWASKFNERAYLSTAKLRIPLNDIIMSVLCQEVIVGEYAYVLHTKDPFTNDSSHIYGELVLGLGETLVGAYEGRAFSFTVSKNNNDYQIESFPNKSVALRGSGFIFRSDSNSEDLPEFAGAGLFDSIIMKETEEEIVSYGNEKIYIDFGFCKDIIFKLKEIGILVENIFNGVPQDIEGVIKGGKIFVVQSRPQI